MCTDRLKTTKGYIMELVAASKSALRDLYGARAQKRKREAKLAEKELKEKQRQQAAADKAAATAMSRSGSSIGSPEPIKTPGRPLVQPVLPACLHLCL